MEEEKKIQNKKLCQNKTGRKNRTADGKVNVHNADKSISANKMGEHMMKENCAYL